MNDFEEQVKIALSFRKEIFGKADIMVGCPRILIDMMKLLLIRAAREWLLVISLVATEKQLKSDNKELNQKLQTEDHKNAFLIEEVTRLNAAPYTAKVEVEAERKCSHYEQKLNEAEQKMAQITAELNSVRSSTAEKFILATMSSYLSLGSKGDFDRIFQSLSEPSTAPTSSPGTPITSIARRGKVTSGAAGKYDAGGGEDE